MRGQHNMTDLKEIVKKYQDTIQYDAQNREDSADDLRFRAGEQWDHGDYLSRQYQNRPTIVLSQIDQYVRKIVGQSRAMSPSVRVFASDLNTPAYMAQLFEGLIRDIEQRTNAQYARMNAHTDQVTCGIGHYEVSYEKHPTKNELQIVVKTIKDPLSVVWDASAHEIDRSDARHCFQRLRMPLYEFQMKFKNKKAINFASSKNHQYSNRYSNNLRWERGGYVDLCRYWEKYTKKHKFIITANGASMDVTDLDDAEILQYQPVDSYSRDIDHLQYQLLSGDEVLEEIKNYPCRHIPIVPVVGEEIFTTNGLYRQGVVRKLREPQKLYNYMMSIAMEQMAQSVKSPYLVTNAMIAGNEALWRKANTNALPFLAYEPDDMNPNLRPERILPPTQHRDTIQMAQVFVNDMSNSAGMHDEALGKETNAKSGKAIQSRQMESAVMTNLFGHHLQASVRQEGRIILSMIKHLFTEPQKVRVLEQDRSEKFVDINQKYYHYPTRQTYILNDMTQGDFEVRADSGPSYGAIKQDALNSLMQLVQLNPQMMPFVLPEMIDMMEVPNQEALKKAVQQYQQMTFGSMQNQSQQSQMGDISQLANLLDNAQGQRT